MGLSGTQHIRAILTALECRGHIIVLADCPFCEDGRDRLELDPQASAYFCEACGRRGKLEQLSVIAEGIFIRRHRESIQLMTTRPGVERGGGRRCNQTSKTSRGSDRPRT